MSNEYILPDVLRSGLKLVVCGSAVGDKSAKANSYYAGYNNMFWKILRETKLTDCLLESKDYHNLLNSDIGLTALPKKPLVLMLKYPTKLMMLICLSKK